MIRWPINETRIVNEGLVNESHNRTYELMNCLGSHDEAVVESNYEVNDELPGQAAAGTPL